MAQGLYRGLDATRADTAGTTTVFHEERQPEQRPSALKRILRTRRLASAKAWVSRKKMASARRNAEAARQKAEADEGAA